MAENFKQRAEYLVNDLRAYDDYDHGRRGLRHAVRNELYRWHKKQKDMTVIQTSVLYRDLWEQAKRKTKSQQLEDALNSDWKAFPTYSSGSNHLRIEDK